MRKYITFSMKVDSILKRGIITVINNTPEATQYLKDINTEATGQSIYKFTPFDKDNNEGYETMICQCSIKYFINSIY